MRQTERRLTNIFIIFNLIQQKLFWILHSICSKLWDVQDVFLYNLGSREDIEKDISLGSDAHLVKAYSVHDNVIEKISEVVGIFGS